MSQLTGRVYVVINGQRLRSKEGATLDIGGVTREEGISDSGVDGFTEKSSVPVIDCEINHSAAISLEQIHAFKNGVAIFRTDSGVQFTLRDAWSAVPPKLSKGGVTLQFKGVECIED